MKPEVVLIAAVGSNGVIGRDQGLAWRDPLDAKHFRDTTMGFPVIMGRKTWDSIPAKFRPLPGRPNIVVTRQLSWRADGAQRAAHLQEAVHVATSLVVNLATHPSGAPPKVFVIGGGELYAQALPMASTLLLTEVAAGLDGDIHFPAWDRQQFVAVHRDEHQDAQGTPFAFVTYRRLT
jgi:dihydrofolate reductase